MNQALEFRTREARRAAERLLAKPALTRYRWRDAVGRCEHCRDGIALCKVGTRWEPRRDSFGRPMLGGRIYSTARLCVAHAYLQEVTP